MNPRTRYTKAALKRHEPTTATWYHSRVQYDSLTRRNIERPANTPTNTNGSGVHHSGLQMIFGLLIVAVAMYFNGLTPGGAKPTSMIVDTPIEIRNQNVAEALADHPTDSLLGEFWRILPANHRVGDRAALVPLAACAKPARPIDSTYRHRSFSYLLTIDSRYSALSHCTVERLNATYGSPSAITITAGTVEHPLEEVLFYDHGARKPLPTILPVTSPENQSSSAVSPIDLRHLKDTSCEGRETIFQIVAHEDDDLLFMNPDLLHAIQQGDCVRTVYLTAGDAGSSKYYWLGRERGSEAAYAMLGGMADDWTTQTVKFGNGRFATVASTAASGQFSLVFMHLPDGKPDGQGFQSSEFESIAKLVSGEKSTIQSVDVQSTYSYEGLIAGLRALMETYRPNEVRTQRPYNTSAEFSDHSDHMITGRLATEAYKQYHAKHGTSKLGYYTGYPIREQPANVDGDDLALKEQAFFIYAQYDAAVCGSVDMCMARGDYGDYLQRQYRTNP